MHGDREFDCRSTLTWEQIVPFTDLNWEQSDPKASFCLHYTTEHTVVTQWLLWARWLVRFKIWFNCDNTPATKRIKDTSSKVLHAPKPDT